MRLKMQNNEKRKTNLQATRVFDGQDQFEKLRRPFYEKGYQKCAV